jgi:phosphoglycolate phosphatase
MIKTIIFDFDGTLADTEDTIHKAVNKHAKRFGYKEILDKEKIRDKSLEEVLFKEMKVPLWKAPYVVWQGRRIGKKEIKEASLFPEIARIVRILQKDYTVGILTSNSTEVVEHVLQKEKVQVNFLESNCSIFQKESAFRRILRKQNLNKNEIVYIGDEIRDVTSCKKVGIPFIGVSWGYNSVDSLIKAGAKNLAKTPSELLGIIRNKLNI